MTAPTRSTRTESHDRAVPPIAREALRALEPPRLLVALFGLLVLLAVGRGWDALVGAAGAESASGPFATLRTGLAGAVTDGLRAAAALDGPAAAAALRGGAIDAPLHAWRTAPGFAIVFGATVLAVAALAGGAIARTAACGLSGGERLSAREAAAFARGAAGRLLGTAFIPLVEAIALMAIMLAPALLLAVPVLDVLGALVWPAALLAGLLAAFLALGLVLGGSLLLPAVACDRADPIDAQQRAFAYALGRPHAMLGWSLAAGAILVAGCALGSAFMAVALGSSLSAAALVVPWIEAASPPWTVAFESWDPLAPSGWHEEIAAAIVRALGALLLLLVPAWAMSYWCSASTAIYLHLRRACDGQDEDEIWRPSRPTA